jgi:hypothetical protein
MRLYRNSEDPCVSGSATLLTRIKLAISGITDYNCTGTVSVADPGCLSRIPDPDPTIFWYPGSWIRPLLSRIPDPSPDPTNKRREKLN